MRHKVSARSAKALLVTPIGRTKRSAPSQRQPIKDGGTILHNYSTLCPDGIMTAPPSLSEKVGCRKLRTHRKSRLGCKNCRLRRVKVGKLPHHSILRMTSTKPRLQCDEAKPRCKRCTTFGVFCNYDSSQSDLQLSVVGAFNIEIPQRFPNSLKQDISSVVGPSLRQQSTGPLESSTFYQLADQDLELLSKFFGRTALTIGAGKGSRLYQYEALELACSASALTQFLAGNPDFDGLVPILDACGTDVDNNA
jgi:hypothetical protein